MEKISSKTSSQSDLFEHSKEVPSVLRLYSGNKWEAIKNSSWGIPHKENFGERAGYVICYKSSGELTALCSVIGQPFIRQVEIDANAHLIELAPDMAKIIEELAILDEEHCTNISELILRARELATQLILNLEK